MVNRPSIRSCVTFSFDSHCKQHCSERVLGNIANLLLTQITAEATSLPPPPHTQRHLPPSPLSSEPCISVTGHFHFIQILYIYAFISMLSAGAMYVPHHPHGAADDILLILSIYCFLSTLIHKSQTAETLPATPATGFLQCHVRYRLPTNTAVG